MLVLLSCAKTMCAYTKTIIPYTDKPRYQAQANHIALQMSQYSVEELEQMLRVNAKLAVENYKRYQVFLSDNQHVLPALLAYTGIVFKRLNPNDFSSDDFDYAQDHLRLTSFCYGLLRPLDLIHPYRLEGNVKLPDFQGDSLFVYWRSILTRQFIDDINAAGGILCNLASDEMRGLFDWTLVENSVQIVTPEFSVVKNGKRSTIVVYTKMMRGEMARFILKGKISTLDDLCAFQSEGFQYDEEHSTKNKPVFCLYS